MIYKPRANLYLSRVLGEGMSPVLVIVSAAFVVISFFYIYSLATYFKITVWDMQGRVSYYSYFETFLISNIVDHLIIALATALWLALSLRHRMRFAIATIYSITAFILALLNLNTILDILAILSLPIIILLIIVNTISPKKFLISDRNLVITYLAIIGIGTGLLSLTVSLLSIYYPDDELIWLRNFAYEVFLIFSSFSPILLISLILCLPVKMVTNEIIYGILKVKNKNIDNMILSKKIVRPLTRVVLLLLFMGLAASMVIIPHQKTINVDNKDVGVDTHYYVEEIRTLINSTSVNELVNHAFVTIQHGDRPLTLLFFFMISKIVPSDNLSYVFDHVPLILGPSLVLAVYFLTRQLTSNDVASLLSAFLTAISFHTLVGIYAGSYANWLALIVGYLSIVFLLRSLKETNKLNLGLFFVLIITALFTHIYTWSILTMVMGIFLLALLKLKYYERRNVILLLIVLSSSVLLDIIRTPITGVYSGIGYDLSPPFGSIVKLGPELYALRWSTILDTTLNYFGSIFGNSIIYALGLYWLIRSKLKEVSTIFLIIFLSIGIIPLFLGNWIVQARVFYDIPFQIPAAIALTYLYERRNGALILTSICIWLAAMSIRAVSNFYFIPPNS